MLKRLTVAAALLACAAPAYASSCYVAEFTAGGAPAGMQVASVPPVTVQSTITASGSSAQSAAFNADTKIIRLFCDATVAVAFGTNPTAAVSGGIPLGSEAPEYFAVRAGDKVAVITR